jgi:biotin operon repressor
MRGKKLCIKCGKSLAKDEVALSQKMLGREISDFHCIDCLAEYLECDRGDLEVKIQEFKEQGCTLFL